LLYSNDPYEQKYTKFNKETHNSFYWVRTRVNGFSVLSPVKRSLPSSKKQNRKRKNKQIKIKPNPDKRGCYRLLNNLPPGKCSFLNPQRW